MRALTPADDDLHPPTSADIFWTETAWFAAAVPERRLTVHTYPVFRTNQNICSAGVYVWDHTACFQHDVLYSHTYWHLPMPATLTRMRLASGLSYDVLEPLRKYHVRYQSDDLSLDLVYEGLMEPCLTPKEDHLDQPCHVTGSLTLRGETIAIDGFEMRDKSWHVRSDRPLALPPDIAKGSYTYGIRGDTAFLAKTGGADRDATMIHGGWLLRGGEVAPLVSGKRTVVRAPSGIGDIIRLDGRDELGRAFEAVGETVNRIAYQSTPAILAWLRGTHWRIDGASAWGEDQEWDANASRR